MAVPEKHFLILQFVDVEVANIASKLVESSTKIGSRNRPKMGPKRLQKRSLETSGRPWGSLGHPKAPKIDFSAILGSIWGPILRPKIVPKSLENEA